jgi:heat-inducible transcriptional repressor
MESLVLDARAQEILLDIIMNYIMTGEPVGSRLVSRMTVEGLSPASVRNVMADLEEMGLLSQPHTSAGRVPTERGYRYYVDSLPPASRVAGPDKALVDSHIARLGGEFSEAMDAIPKLLSLLTRQVGYFVSPPISGAVLKHIEFVKLHDRRILVIFVDGAEMVSHRILETEEEYSKDDLERAGRYLVTEFEGLTLRDIRARLVKLMAEEKAAFDRLLQNAIALGTRYLDAESDERKMVVDGAANLLKHPDLAEAGILQRLFETFEEKSRLVNLLDRCLERGRVQVVIGSEAADPVLGNLSLVASPYSVNDGACGWFGILGPTRMEYGRMVGLLDYISRLLSPYLTRLPG